MMKFRPWFGDPRDPACPYSDTFTPEDEQEAYDDYVDRCIDDRMEREG